MVLDRPGTPLTLRERPVPQPGEGEILIEVASCGVCRTDLHVVDGELPDPKLPIVPGHEIVGRVAAIGSGVSGFALGAHVGVPWLAAACGVCPYCRAGRVMAATPPTPWRGRASRFRCRTISIRLRPPRFCAPA
jgi:propanol-preferring alcohol dehydrogenase